MCIFGREVTPNHHKLVEEFVLLDNFYCSGVLSADGHQWTNEAYVTDYLEKAFGGFPRSYPYPGGDAMAYAPTGFIWDNVLAHRKRSASMASSCPATIRWKDPARQANPTFIDCYRDFVDGTGLDRRAGDGQHQDAGELPVPHGDWLSRASCPTFTARRNSSTSSSNLKRRANFPTSSIMLLPNDHTSGTRPGMPTPEAAVADNDLALGPDRRSDQPQQVLAGDVHLRRRRTIRKPASTTSTATARWHWSSARTHAASAVDSTNYNQTSMVRTIELMLGPAADEPARLVGHADGQLLHGHSPT